MSERERGRGRERDLIEDQEIRVGDKGLHAAITYQVSIKALLRLY